MNCPLVPGIYLNPHMPPSCSALTARFVPAYYQLQRELTVIANGKGMCEATVVCHLGVSAEIL